MSRLRPVALFLSLGLLWGLSFPAITVGLSALDPLFFAATRYDVAAVALLAYAVFGTERWRPTGRDDVLAVLAGGVFLVAGNSLLFVGQQTTTSGVAAIIYSLIPILTTVFAFLLLADERLSRTGLLGVCFGLVGVVIIARPEPGNPLAAGVVGKLLILAAAASVALGSVLIRRLSPSLDDAGLTGWSMLAGAVFLHVGSLATGESVPGALSPAVLTAVVYLGTLATAVAFLIYFHLLGTYGPLQSNLVSYVVPVVATVAGALLLDEPITPLTVVGFAVILLGFVLLQRRSLARFLAERRGTRA
ncbi:DMT family transporter [Halomarina litorea]|uniref:DMT family transporter n=1 Tax=Halomarina litorea TaxID=2961595 RepID=UPI0020C1D56A|nr:EamA family transporter [Halomarina sp. BCD28]